MTTLTLRSIDTDGRFNPTADDMARLVAFLMDDAVIDAINERAADDRPAVDEAPWTVGDCASLAYGQYDLGTRCIVSGGEVMEIDSKEDSDADIPF